MTLRTGARVGSYQVVGAIGTGGMGEVYRARDTKLHRDVALKVLPEAFTQDRDRLARFHREAQVLAALNHSNIAQIYGVEEADGCQALVLELVDGPTLADRLARGSMSLEEALRIARQITDALEAAHVRGIVHRDLKPANIKLRADGTVKVLDFGLAKVLESRPAGSGGSDLLSDSPTLTAPAATGIGVVLGTVAYMAPEQAKGHPIDKRADIWAFGCVFYEMLTGRRAFQGASPSEVLASVIRGTPDWSALPVDTPVGLEKLLSRCLEKDPHDRLHDIADARLEIRDSTTQPHSSARKDTAVALRRGQSLPWLLTGASVLALAWLALFNDREQAREAPLMRVEIASPEEMSWAGPFAISPDGRQVAAALTSKGTRSVWVRMLDSLSWRALPGTEYATYLFWSPDSRFIAFIAGQKLHKIEVSGGPPQVLCDAPNSLGGDWNRDGVIVFSAGVGAGLYRVSAAGGGATPVTRLDESQQEYSHYWPHFLPDGRRFIFFAQAATSEQPRLYLASVDSPERSLLLTSATAAAYSSGHLLFTRGETLMAQRLDIGHAALLGNPLVVAENVAEHRRGLVNPHRAFSVSGTGTVSYFGGSVGAGSNRQLQWVDRAGHVLSTLGSSGSYGNPALFVDETRVAVESGTGNVDIWLIDVKRELPTRLTFDPALDVEPVWSPDRHRLVFSSTSEGAMNLYWQDLTSDTGAEVILRSPNLKYARDWSQDGRFILFEAVDVKTNWDLWVMPVEGTRPGAAFRLLQTPFNELEAQLSPDGAWYAYASDESGRYEIYARRFHGSENPSGGSGAAVRISTGGGRQPRWSRSGNELFYLAADGTLTAVSVASGESLAVGAPRSLFPAQGLQADQFGGFEYAVGANGQRFLLNLPTDSAPRLPMTLVLNWAAGITQ